ncbi:MAG: hypothetical protein ACJAWO_002516 [Halieaceae bacterium]
MVYIELYTLKQKTPAKRASADSPTLNRPLGDGGKCPKLK